MTAASVAALTVYDMVKGVERGVEIRAVRLVSKTGGKSGTWVAPADPPADAGAARRAATRAIASPAASGRSGKRVRGERRCRPVGARPHRQRRRAAPAPARTRRATRVEARLAALGFAVERRSSPTSSGRSRPRCATAPTRHAARRHDRRHRPDAARRDAAGDPRRARLRGPRARRGDARRRPRDDAARRPVARRRRRPRADAHRQPARQPEGRHSNRSRRSSPCSTTPSRPSPDRTTTGGRDAT